ncbi:hypothetical protein DSO57_1022521 [Entomophthora muscae]|uniref:Uncharacterized protein n=1 Tax=Entomophthora muscae TaxID=34485 RepID=A0ACC2RU80_9FUNG|nr:hypothetical protein DSO57_1022521 [Entomophthora muscae]
MYGTACPFLLPLLGRIILASSVLDDIPEQACKALISGIVLIQNLAPNKGDFSLAHEMSPYSLMSVAQAPLPKSVSKVTFVEPFLQLPQSAPGHTPGLLSDMLLMAVNT